MEDIKDKLIYLVETLPANELRCLILSRLCTVQEIRRSLKVRWPAYYAIKSSLDQKLSAYDEHEKLLDTILELCSWEDEASFCLKR